MTDRDKFTSTTRCMHHGDEPTSAQTYLVCMHCGHAFQTEQDLVDKYNEAVARLLRGSIPPDAVIATTGEMVLYCPFCTEDF